MEWRWRRVCAISQNIFDLPSAANAKMIRVKITLIHGEPIVIGSFYRLSDNNADSIEDLKIAKYINS